ncbi:MAG: ABC transporter permease [Ignavibacteriales bacterium]|nr:ABC transporter permease [Ignavibacteriales bacterium]
MFRYLIKQYVRNISRRKLFSFINVTGLAFGIAFIILIGQFVYYEFNYNTGLKNIDNIYRLVDVGANNYDADYRIKDQILASVPGVKNVSILNKYGTDANAGGKVFQIKDMLVVDRNFFDIFNCTFIHGNAKYALNTLDDVVLTETTAKNIFGTADAVGKTLRLNHKYDMLVTGVVKDLPENLSFNAEIFVNAVNSPKQRLFYKMSCLSFDQCKYPFDVFVEVEKNADVKKIEAQIASLNNINSYLFPKKIKLTPLKTNYFNTGFDDSNLMHGNVELIKILSVIGVIILLLAVVNFVNLATAAYRYRLTEMGVKKCLGANRSTLIKQLLIEALFTCTISSLLGIILAVLFLPYFNRFVDKPLALQIFNDPVFFILFAGFILFLGIAAGFLPAVVLSKISPIQLFKLNPYLKGTGKKYRGVLTVFQFAVTIILISGLIVITKQIDFVKHKDLGFNTEKLLYLKIHFTLKDRLQVIENKLRQYHGIKSLTKTLGRPGEIRMFMQNYETILIDSTSLKVFGIEIIKGRNLLAGDVDKACLVNQTALKNFKGGDFINQKVNGKEIVGVVSDFHYSSLYNEIGQLALMYNPNWSVCDITMRVSGPIGNAISYIKKTWEEICPDYPLEFGFYDENFATMYKKEENLAALVSIFSILAVVISCMGIFGLSIFQSEQRIKEIGVRKVLGADAREIILLLTKSFSKWVIIANVIAIPVAYYFLNQWLEDFAYRIEISWWIFVLSGLIALLIALATVSFQAIKAAMSNPVEALRYE